MDRAHGAERIYPYNAWKHSLGPNIVMRASVMLKSNDKTRILMVVVLLVGYIGDRVLKLIFLNFPEASGKVFFQPFFSTFLYTNERLPFGVNIPSVAIVATGVLLLGVVGVFFLHGLRKSDFLASWGWGLVLFGGLSNMWDRIRFGYVIDWLVVPWEAVVNVADIYILIGVVVLFFTFLSEKKDTVFSISELRK